MLTPVVSLIALIFTLHPTLAAPNIAARAESHKVELINRCGSGTPRMIDQANGTPVGGSTYNRSVKGGIAWLDGLKLPNGQSANCGVSGVNCGIMEFTLINPDSDPANTHSSINYSLLKGVNGNHQFTYPMYFKYTGACTHGAPGLCTADNAASCPGAYLGMATAGGTPVQCQKANVGAKIIFCPTAADLA